MIGDEISLLFCLLGTMSSLSFFAAREKTPVRSLRFCGHSRELAQLVKRAERDQFEVHQMSLAQRQLFEHFVCCCGIRDIQDECNTPAILQRVPLLDLAIQIEADRFSDFVR